MTSWNQMRYAILVLALGCSSAQPEPEKEKPVVRPVNDRLQEYEKFEKEAMQRYSIEDQQRIAESGQHYRLALSFFRNSSFMSAKEHAEKAMKTWPYNLEARKLFSEIQGILNGETGSTVIQGPRIAVEQAKLEISNHVRDGERYYNAHMYREAIREFERAEYKILAMPYSVPTLDSLLPDVRAGLRRARDAGK